MTENEAKTLLCQMYLPQFDEEEKQALTMAIQALEEIQQHRAIGTVEELKRAKQIETLYEQIKWERDIAISQLEEIGVGLGQKMDDIKNLKEKATPKKPMIERRAGMITPINSMTIEQITERKHDLLVSEKDIHEISRVARLEAIEVFVKVICDRAYIENGFLKMRVGYLKELAEQMKKGSAKNEKT